MVSVNAHLSKHPKLSVRSPLVIIHVQNSRPGCKYTCSCWTLTETLPPLVLPSLRTSCLRPNLTLTETLPPITLPSNELPCLKSNLTPDVICECIAYASTSRYTELRSI